jgi:hypothetical protein
MEGLVDSQTTLGLMILVVTMAFTVHFGGKAIRRLSDDFDKGQKVFATTYLKYMVVLASLVHVLNWIGVSMGRLPASTGIYLW